MDEDIVTVIDSPAPPLDPQKIAEDLARARRRIAEQDRLLRWCRLVIESHGRIP